ncbi:MAG TPA: LPS export ABC transporter periplasmic protein LptC [Blastocatellia bacterium]|nr:LPS export ABC transporter periplasmic protein LptC [Blastocatellia bacterium]
MIRRQRQRHLSPRLVRLAAVLLFGAIVAVLVISYRNQYGFLQRGHSPFAETTSGRRLISVSDNLRHVQTERNQTVFVVTAARAEVYDDGHRELKDVVLTVYRSSGQPRARITAARASYNESTRSVIFASNVEASTDDGLTLKTERLYYDQPKGVIRTDVPVTFSRDGFQGESHGLVIETEQEREQVVLSEDVSLVFEPRQSDRGLRGSPLTARCDLVRYRRATSMLELIGSVVMTQRGHRFRADRIEAFFDAENRLKQVNAFGNARLESQEGPRRSELASRTMGFFFGGNQQLVRAIATGDAWVRIAEALGVRELRTSRIEVNFAALGRQELYPSEVKGDGGRVELFFSAPPAVPSGEKGIRRILVATPSSKRLQANAVHLIYRPERRIFDRIVAEGDVSLAVEPVSGKSGEHKTVQADRMELRFFDRDNLMKELTAEGHVRVEVRPNDPQDGPSRIRIATSDHLKAEFDSTTQDIAWIVQSGHFRYREGDRQASGERAVYDQADGAIRLRGNPEVWDDRGRTRATEIDLNLRAETIVARGKVLTAYVNRRATGGAAPFGDARAPIFLAADRLEVDRQAAAAIYSGGARAWQDDSYVAADVIELRQTERMMIARGSVRSLFYRARRADVPSKEAIPVFVSADRLTYRDALRVVEYAGGVLLKRGSQRLSAERVTVTLKLDVAEIERATAERNVTLTEPSRRALGDHAVYTAATDEIVLTGAPARVDDDRQHLSQKGARLTFLLADDKVFVETDGGSRRVKTTKKIQ